MGWLKGETETENWVQQSDRDGDYLVRPGRRWRVINFYANWGFFSLFFSRFIWLV